MPRHKKTRYPKPDWKAQNWSLSDPEIAKVTGATPNGVSKARKRHATGVQPLQYDIARLEKALDETKVPAVAPDGCRFSTFERLTLALLKLELVQPSKVVKA